MITYSIHRFIKVGAGIWRLENEIVDRLLGKVDIYLFNLYVYMYMCVKNFFPYFYSLYLSLDT